MKPLNKPIWVGLALAPLTAPVLFVVLGLVFGKDNTPKHEFSGLESWPLWAGFFVGVAVLSYGVTLTIGTYLVSVLRRFGKFEFWSLIVSSAVLGAMVFIVVILVIAWGEKSLWLGALWFAGYGLLLGCGVSVTFCFLTGVTNDSLRRM